MTDILALTGMTVDELSRRIVAQAVRELLWGTTVDSNDDDDDDDDDEPAEARVSSCDAARDLRKRLEKESRDAIDREVKRLAAEIIGPVIAERVSSVVLQRHNQWGDPIGKPATFKEYLVSRVDEFLNDRVDRRGYTRGERSGYSWDDYSSRAAWLVNQSLVGEVRGAVKEALSDAGNVLAAALKDAVLQTVEELKGRLHIKAELT